MKTHKFFACPNCGNIEKFLVFTSNFQLIKQSPEIGSRIYESEVLPNLQQSDNYIECQLCFRRSEFNTALDLGQKYVDILKLLKLLK